MFHTRIFHRRFESGRNTMKENTVALKFYNIAIDASLIDRRNKKNIVSKMEEIEFYIYYTFLLRPIFP